MTHEPGASGGDGQDPFAPGVVPSWPPPPVARPVGVPPSGSHPVPYGPPPHHLNPYAAAVRSTPHGYGPAMRHPDARPGTVLAAGITALATTGVVLLVLIGALVALLVARDELLEGLTDESLSAAEAETAFLVGVVVLGVVMAWCLVAIWMAVLALRRSRAGRVGLTICAGLTAAVSLVTLVSGASVLTLAAAVVVVVCLHTGGAGDWYHREHLFSPPRMPKV